MLALKPNLDVGEVSSGVQSLKLSGRSGGKKERRSRSGGKEVSGDGTPREEDNPPLLDHKGKPVLDCNGKPLRGKYNLVPEDPNVPFDIDDIKLTDSDEEMVNELVDQMLKRKKEAKERKKYTEQQPQEDPPSPTFDDDDEEDWGLGTSCTPYELPGPLKCDLCGLPHFESACPYLMELPPNGKLLDKNGYMIVCQCGNELADESTLCPQLPFHPNYTRHVEPKCDFMFTVPLYSLRQT